LAHPPRTNAFIGFGIRIDPRTKGLVSGDGWAIYRVDGIRWRRPSNRDRAAGSVGDDGSSIDPDVMGKVKRD
jgi:hypothetical protein